jgi:hypothetical protein
MGHFTTTETQGDFHLVAFVDEGLHGAKFHLIVVLVDIGAHLDLFDLDDFLLLLGFVLLFLLFIFELAEVQDLHDRWVGVRADFKQVETNLKGALKRLAARHDAGHFAVLIDQTYLGRPDFLIHTRAIATRGKCRLGWSRDGDLLWQLRKCRKGGAVAIPIAGTQPQPPNSG